MLSNNKEEEHWLMKEKFKKYKRFQIKRSRWLMNLILRQNFIRKNNKKIYKLYNF